MLELLLPVLVRSGAGILADIVGAKSPAAGKVVEKIGQAIGTAATPTAIVEKYNADPETVGPIIRQVEAENPAYWSMLAAADQIRADIFRQEAAEPWWAWAWRPFWMWLLAAFWGWEIVGTAFRVPVVDFGTMIWLTTAYLALYMGGHTVKDAVTKLAGKGT